VTQGAMGVNKNRIRGRRGKMGVQQLFEVIATKKVKGKKKKKSGLERDADDVTSKECTANEKRKTKVRMLGPGRSCPMLHVFTKDQILGRACKAGVRERGTKTTEV